MSLRDQLIADVSTFLNVAEFGETIDIDGVPMSCVLDNDETTNSADGVSNLETTLYVRASDFDEAPVVRQRMTIGARQANVTRIDDEQGILLIRVQWFDS
jgi:hypothetical protein